MPRILNEDFSVAEHITAAPICGEDFCDLCGDCLACYSGDSCPEGGHSWVVYAEDAEEFKATHPQGAKP
jgi:ferredoxin